MSPNNRNRFIFLFPVLGILLFVIFYFLATCYYPGGNQYNKNAIGFSWQHNYWCNLQNQNAINGSYNTGVFFARTASLLLSVSLLIFWWFFPIYMGFKKWFIYTMQVAALISMLLSFFSYSGNHDWMVNLAAGFGGVAVISTQIGLYKKSWHLLFYFGIVNFLLVLINNYFYYDKALLFYLPVVQKITFVSFLIWICCICRKLYFIPRTVNSIKP